MLLNHNDFEARDKHYFSKFPVDVWKKYNLSEKELLSFRSKKSRFLKNKIRMYFFIIISFGTPKKIFITCKKIQISS